MERTKTLRSGLRTATAVVFLAAALLSTGCSGNALLNPQPDQSAQSTSTANAGGQPSNPGGQLSNP
jgi:hypothetical protein